MGMSKMKTIKQHIDKIQWEELSEEQQDLFIPRDVIKQLGYAGNTRVNIGQIIGYLGNYLLRIIVKPNCYEVVIDNNQRERDGLIYTSYYAKELCDALWFACVYKLKQNVKT